MYGVDVEGEWKVTRELDINFGAEWLNAKFSSFPDMHYVELVPGGGVVAGTGSLDGKGKEIRYAPKFTLEVGASTTLYVRDAKSQFNGTEAYKMGKWVGRGKE